jgi:heat-inducible transcriptional repressor
LDERRHGILKQTVHTFIVVGEPVGSRTLSKLYPSSLSSATIRNVMSDLEEMGFLSQPHASAGRVPTDKGYRFYVGTLNREMPLSASQRERIVVSLNPGCGAPEELVQASSHLLAELGDTVSFATAPDFRRSLIRHIHFVELSPGRVLVVLVSERGQVAQKVITVEGDYSREELGRSARYLESEFRGSSLLDARERLLALMVEERTRYDALVRKALMLGEKAFSDDAAPPEVYLDGTARMLVKREFANNMARARQALATMDEKGRLLRILNACLGGERSRVVIGSEARVPDFEGLSIIAARYSCGGQDLGSLGVMGPTRMEYAKLIALVNYMAASLSSALTSPGEPSSH